jgi:hypothetical protein
LYKLEKLYADADTSIAEENRSTDVIYKNFIPNKYYNQTNVNGEYYNKEDMLNIYNLDFELIQVFYQEDLTDT